MKTLTRWSWLPAIVSALAISTYSLYWVARMWGLPGPLAVLVSTVFDGSALTFADLALKYARTQGDSGFAPRLAVLTLAGVSAYLNSWHAVLTGDPSPARLLYAAPPVVSIVLFDLHTRYERRAAMQRAGRVPVALPVYGRWVWVLFPVRTFRALRTVVASRLDSAQNTGPGYGVTDGAGSSGKHRQARNWAKAKGYQVSDRGPLPREIVTAYEAEQQGLSDPDATVTMPAVAPDYPHTPMRTVRVASGGRYAVPEV